ncbi:hypothetical protein E2C01_005188 [Portunus trituberculatus]|uniref:Uncharacterized protein n=1 Tax=Portunus trituberculatus TaxID=210409 RepID=A0A5B7CSN8_PORTR|nr:hypothetical protein [Portunus trituberculatus]
MAVWCVQGKQNIDSANCCECLGSSGRSELRYVTFITSAAYLAERRGVLSHGLPDQPARRLPSVSRSSHQSNAVITGYHSKDQSTNPVIML